MIGVKRENKQVHNFLRPSIVSSGSTDQTASAGRIYLCAYDIPLRCQLKSLTISNGTTVAGNVTVGVYGKIATPFSPNGEALIATSSSTALTGSLTPQTIAFTTNPVVQPGQYYVAIECSDATHQLKVNLGSTSAIASARGYSDQAYGALPATFPAITNSPTGAIVSGIEVITVP